MAVWYGLIVTVLFGVGLASQLYDNQTGRSAAAGAQSKEGECLRFDYVTCQTNVERC